MTDPYRGDTMVGSCPRCGATLERDAMSLVCLAGCGALYSREAPEIAKIWDEIDHAPRVAASPWPWTPARCPLCQREMALAYRGEVRFDRCSEHGVWLDAGEYERFRVI